MRVVGKVRAAEVKDGAETDSRAKSYTEIRRFRNNRRLSYVTMGWTHFVRTSDRVGGGFDS